MESPTVDEVVEALCTAMKGSDHKEVMKKSRVLVSIIATALSHQDQWRLLDIKDKLPKVGLVASKYLDGRMEVKWQTLFELVEKFVCVPSPAMQNSKRYILNKDVASILLVLYTEGGLSYENLAAKLSLSDKVFDARLGRALNDELVAELFVNRTSFRFVLTELGLEKVAKMRVTKLDRANEPPRVTGIGAGILVTLAYNPGMTCKGLVDKLRSSEDIINDKLRDLADKYLVIESGPKDNMSWRLTSIGCRAVGRMSLFDQLEWIHLNSLL